MAARTYSVAILLLLVSSLSAQQCDKTLSREPSFVDLIVYGMGIDDLYEQNLDYFAEWSSTGDWVHTLTYGYSNLKGIRIFLDSTDRDGTVYVTNGTTSLGDVSWTAGVNVEGAYLVGNNPLGTTTAIIQFDPPVGAFSFKANTGQGTVAQIEVHSSMDQFIGCTTVVHTDTSQDYTFTTLSYKIRSISITGPLFVLDTILFTPCPIGASNLGYGDGDEAMCVDDNECQTSSPCHSNADCTNTNYYYECTCKSGYEGPGTPGEGGCVDIDECENNPCDSDADCSNSNGSFECECHEGYSGDGFTCSDLNECNDDPCSEFADCDNTLGSFECFCWAGYDGDGFECTDINECDDDPCSELAACDNIDGSYTCTCAGGYEGNGIGAGGCVDVNECDSNPCDENASCTNDDGAFECKCNRGYTGDGLSSCVDVNECVENTPCALYAVCQNTEGAYTCTCPDGYTGTGIDDDDCIDINECVEDPCHAEATCNNTAGSFLCSCNEGFEGDGFDCTVRVDTGNTPVAEPVSVPISPPVASTTPVSNTTPKAPSSRPSGASNLLAHSALVASVMLVIAAL